MAQITATYKADLAEGIGAKSEGFDAATVGDVLGQIKARHGKDTCKLARTMLITLNGLSIQKERRFATRLKDGDVVGFFPLAAGG
ncbi:MAG: MoaD/ThiS family protein [Coriobacteriales bacterium]|jgi:molybdopterin converting factor small subunit|nr:MoaD/ThiS family protein [Coriobacteriales bacterium]